MSSNPIRGKTLWFTFDDGPMAGKTFEHRFDDGGTVSFRALAGDATAAKETPDRAPGTRYEVAAVRDGIWAVSYLSSSGYTLTVVLDFATKKLLGFSSNEKMLALQHGTFRDTAAAPDAKTRSDAGAARH
jgi:MoaF N-terminal domain